MNFIGKVKTAVIGAANQNAPHEERQRAALTCMLLFGYSGSTIIFTVLNFLTATPGAPNDYRWALLFFSICYSSLYLMSRTKRYKISALIWITIQTLSLALISATAPNKEITIATIQYFVPAVFMASIIFGSFGTAFWSITSLLIAIVVPISIHMESKDIVNLVVFNLFNSALAIISSFMQKSFVVRAQSAEVEAKKNLERVESLLKNVPLGILTVTREKTIGDKYSPFLESIVEKENLSGRPVLKTIWENAQLSGDQKQMIDACFNNIIGETSLAYEMNSHLLPTRFSINVDGKQKLLEASYDPIVLNDYIEELLVVIRDITEIEQIKEENAKQSQTTEKVFKILSISQEDFLDYVAKGKKYTSSALSTLNKTSVTTEQEIALLYRNFHTLKGASRIFAFSEIADEVHELENKFNLLKKAPSDGTYKNETLKQVQSIEDMVSNYKKLYDENIGRYISKNKLLLEKNEKLAMLAKKASRLYLKVGQEIKDDAKKLRDFFHGIYSISFADTIKAILSDVPSLAKSLSKEPPQIIIEGGEVLISEHQSSIIKDLLVHVIRNCLDHGIEPSAERMAKNKVMAGKINISCKIIENGRVSIDVSDDGRGLNHRTILAKAKALKLIKPEEEKDMPKVLNCIFQPGFSTKEEATSISGRGVGLDAVKDFVQENAGEVHLEFLEGKGDFYQFKLVITFPLDSEHLEIIKAG